MAEWLQPAASAAPQEVGRCSGIRPDSHAPPSH